MKTKPSKTSYLTAIITAIAFIAGIFYFTWERYDVSDYDAAGAYSGMVSILCLPIGLSIKDISFAKKILIGIGVANLLILLFLIVDCGYSNERMNLIYLTIFFIAVHVGFYIWMRKKEKEQAAQEKDE